MLYLSSLLIEEKQIETFDELKYIKENGVHPRDLDPTEGFARGGIVEVLI